MKTGLLIASGVVLLLAVICGGVMYGIADSPTSATSPAKLVKQELPPNLPSLFKSQEPTADANNAYQRAFDFYLTNQRSFTKQKPPQEMLRELTDHLIAAMNAGRLDNFYLDSQIPLVPSGRPSFDDALEVIPYHVLTSARSLFEKKQSDRALQAALACWALGQRAFQQCRRHYPRFTGLNIMETSATVLSQFQDQCPNLPPLDPWFDSIQKIQKNWQGKSEVLYDLKAHPADLVNIADNDKDPTWRLEAVLRLGAAKFRPGGRGNRRIIRSCISRSQSDDDSFIAKAAKTAEDFTLEDFRKLR